jgi:hypothetical protein
VSLARWGDREPARRGTVTMPWDDLPVSFQEAIASVFNSHSTGGIPYVDITLRRARIAETQIGHDIETLRSHVTFEIAWETTSVEPS